MIVLIDDILIYSKNENEHECQLMLAFHVLKEHQLHANSIKCYFWWRSVAFLSHIIHGDFVEVDQNKMDVARNWPRPLTLIDIISFLGLARYYRIVV